MEKELHLLEQYIEQGFCLHGSNKRIEVLEPRQAKCETGKMSGCQKAVYASKDCVCVPCIMAMISKLDPSKSAWSSYGGNEGRKLAVTCENMTFRPGYVHVLPSDTFQDMDGEFISFVPVKPIAVVRITPEILSLFTNLENHVPY